MGIRRCFVFIASVMSTFVCIAAHGASMQAAIVSAGRIRIQMVPKPVPGVGQVLIKVAYAGVNPADWKRASGKPEDADVGRPPPDVLIPGLDGSGVVAGLGSHVTKFKVGDAVLFWSRSGGSYAQYIAVAIDTVALKPQSLPFAQAAGIPHAGLAAFNLLIDVARVHAGQSVLVLGGAGGVGSAAVQIAKLRGARVIATASARNADYLTKLGADSVIDYGARHFEEQLRDIDVAVNAVDTDNAYRALAVVKRGGYLVSVAGLPSSAECATRGVVCSARSASGTPIGTALEQMAAWTQTGQFSINIDRTFGMNQVFQAWAYSQAGHTRGKSVIQMSE